MLRPLISQNKLDPISTLVVGVINNSDGAKFSPYPNIKVTLVCYGIINDLLTFVCITYGYNTIIPLVIILQHPPNIINIIYLDRLPLPGSTKILLDTRVTGVSGLTVFARISLCLCICVSSPDKTQNDIN